MISKAQIKNIQSLSRQKYRKEYNLYLVEGDKNCKEWLRFSCKIAQIYALQSWVDNHQQLLAQHPESELNIVEEFELDKITSLKHAQQVLMVVEKPKFQELKLDGNEWVLFLEKIQDPGNMGTIIRTADWFGISKILITPDCVEIFNPKVVQSTMGSLLRIDFYEIGLQELAKLMNAKTPLYAACLEGKNIHEFKTPYPGIIAMGNESQGLSHELLQLADFKLTVPRIGAAESLNVGVATGIICAVLI